MTVLKMCCLKTLNKDIEYFNEVRLLPFSFFEGEQVILYYRSLLYCYCCETKESLFFKRRAAKCNIVPLVTKEARQSRTHARFAKAVVCEMGHF